MNIFQDINFWSLSIQSIITSFLAAFIFLLLLFCLRPRIKISDKICQAEDGFKIKIMNKSFFFKLYDVWVEFVILIPKNVPGGQNLSMEKLKMRNDKIWFIQRRPILKRNSVHATHAIQFTCEDEIIEKWNPDNGHILHFKVIAKHGLSSFVKIKTIKYHDSSDIIAGRFGHGANFNIV